MGPAGLVLGIKLRPGHIVPPLVTDIARREIGTLAAVPPTLAIGRRSRRDSWPATFKRVPETVRRIFITEKRSLRPIV